MVKGLIGGLSKVVQGIADFAPARGIFETILFGTAGWAGMQKLKQLGWVESIGTQFANLAVSAKNATFALKGMSGPMQATAGAAGMALPIFLGITAAVVGLSAAFAAMKKAAYEKSYEGITNSMSEMSSEVDELDAQIQSYKDRMAELNDSEKAYLDTLKSKKMAMELDYAEKQEESWAALSKEVHKATHYVGQWYDKTTGQVSYQDVNMAQEAFQGIVDSYKNGERYTDSYQKKLTGFISTYGDLVGKLQLAEQAGAELDSEEMALISAFQIASNELAEVTGNTQAGTSANMAFAHSFDDIKNGADAANAALEQYQAKASYDYSAPVKGYQSAFKDLQKQLESGTASIDQIQAAVDLFLPEDAKSRLHYDLGEYAEELGSLFSGKLGTVLSASDPLAGLVGLIQQNGGQIIDAFDNVAASIDADGQLSITSVESLASALGTSTGMAQALLAAIQGISGQFVFTTDDIANLNSALMDYSSGVFVASTASSDLVHAIMNITGATDPTEIKAYIDALYELNGIEMDEEKEIEVNAAIDSAVNGLTEVATVEEEITDKDVTIEAICDKSPWDDAKNVYDQLKNKHVTITVSTLYSGERHAKGTKSAKGGTALVNDGSPVNGSSAEAIVSNGRMFIAGGGQETIVPLNAGDEVYNARDTQQILKASGLKESDLYGGIRALQSGTTKVNVSKYLGGAGGATTGGALGASGAITISTKDPKAMKEEFDKWLKEKKHALAMDEITEAEYYRDLEEMNEKYLANREEYLDEYWQHQEEIYKYQKQGLDDIIQREEKLNELAKAKTQKVLVYKDGMFQYIQNTEAIAKAQRAVDGNYANGTTNAIGGLSLVGENGPELRVLDSGDGVVPADMTRNLMRLGRMSMGSLANGSSSTDIFNIGEVILENVNNVEDIFAGLKNLALQKATSRI